jgi:hypothetical protein
MAKFSGKQALLEYMLDGNRVSLLEAILLFGVQAPNAEFTRIKRQNFIVKSQKVPMARIMARIQKYTACEAPSELPTREILMTEYWLDR